MTDRPPLTVRVFTGGLLETNGYLISCGEAGSAPVLVDAPSGIARWLEDAGVRPAALFLTHQHFDHIESAAEVKETVGCPVYAWAPHSPALTLEDFFGGFDGMSLEVRRFEVDHVLEGQGRIESEGMVFELLHVPGHSPDSVCFFHRESGTLFGGDVLMRGGVGRSDFPGGDNILLIKGIEEKLLPLGDGVSIHPGHGPETTVGAEQEMIAWLAGASGGMPTG